MSTAYTPGLLIQENTEVTVFRELPLPGRTLVKVGDTVRAESEVLSAELPGEVQILRIAERLGFDPARITAANTLRPGDPVTRGERILELRYFFGLFTASIDAPIDGTVEFYTESTAHLGIRGVSQPLTVRAYIDGTISAITEGRGVTITTNGAHLQGAFGVGGERSGTLHPLTCDRTAVVTAELLRGESIQPGSIIVGGARFTRDALSYAETRKASGVITGSIDADTLRQYIGYEVGVSMTGDEEIPFPLVITEGFGTLPISERFFDTVSKYRNFRASMNGQTQVRAGAVRPELIIPTPKKMEQIPTPPTLIPGAKIRCIRTPFFGEFGVVDSLPPEPEQIESGAIVRVAIVKLDSGKTTKIPRANIELC